MLLTIHFASLKKKKKSAAMLLTIHFASLKKKKKCSNAACSSMTERKRVLVVGVSKVRLRGVSSVRPDWLTGAVTQSLGTR